jgi:hypothetical protein
MALLLNDAQAYSLGIYRNFKPNGKAKREALLERGNSRVEDALGAYMSNFMTVTIILTIFMIKTDDDKKITKYQSASYQKSAQEFLNIMDSCDQFEISILNVAKRTKYWTVPYLKQGQNPKSRYDFEKKIPAYYLELRANYLSSISEKAYRQTVSNFFAPLRLEI